MVASSVFIATYAAGWLLLLAHWRWVAELAAVAALKAGSKIQIAVEAASAVADIQVLVA